MTDANYLQHEFSPTFTEADLVNVESPHVYIKTIVHGEPVVPFSLDTTKDMRKWKALLNPQIGQAIRELSRLKFGRDATQVEAEIASRARL